MVGVMSIAAMAPTTLLMPKLIANMRLAEMYYTRPPADRPRFLLELICEAIEGNSKVKRVLTNHVFLRPNRSDKHKFWRGTSNYPTLAQEAHRLCKAVVGVGVDAVISGGWDLFDQLASTEQHVLEVVLTKTNRPTSTAIGQGQLKQGRQLGPLARLAYSAALTAARVSVVRTERRHAA